MFFRLGGGGGGVTQDADNLGKSTLTGLETSNGFGGVVTGGAVPYKRLRYEVRMSRVCMSV